MICVHCGAENVELVKGFGIGDLLSAVVCGASAAVAIKVLRGELKVYLEKSGPCECVLCREMRARLNADGPAPLILGPNS